MRRDDENGKFDRVGDAAKFRVERTPKELTLPLAEEVDRAAIAALHKVARHPVAKFFRGGGCADDNNTFWLEEGEEGWVHVNAILSQTCYNESGALKGKEVHMFDAKLVADSITAVRGLLGFVMVWLGFTKGMDALPAVVMLMLIDWTGDFVDGSLAKLSRHPRRTWIGENDLYIDLFVSLCLGIYLVSAGFVGLAFGVCYATAWALLLLRFGLDRNLLMLIQAPIYLWLILTALRLVPESGYWLVLWVLAATAINWKRFTREIIPHFLDGMGSIWRGRHS
jgi:hypothetical protein